MQSRSGKKAQRVRDDASMRYFDSRFFKRLFGSYAIMIALFVLLYLGWYVISIRRQNVEQMENICQQQTVAYGTAMDQQLFSAQSMCAAVNLSDNCRNIFQNSHVRQEVIDSMQLYRVLNELTRIRSAGGNMNIYSLLLCFQDETKAYMPGAVMDFTGTPQMPQSSVTVAATTISQMLGVTNHSQVLFNKEYFIYAEDYSAYNSTPKGVTLVLFELSSLQQLVGRAASHACGAGVLVDGAEVVRFGECEGRVFVADSMLNSTIRYEVFIPESVFATPFISVSLLPILLILLLGGAFMLATYFVSRHFYRPIDNISRMIDPQQGSGNDIDDIMAGIRSLIGERNGYREKLITISPYAEQGMVHSLISGGAQNQQSALLMDNEFFELQKTYYAVGLVNVVNMAARDTTAQPYDEMQRLIRHICREMTDDDVSVVCCAKNPQNTYVVVNSDDPSGIEQLFYTLHAKICEQPQSAPYAITLGVSAVETELRSLQTACTKAEQALRHMITGGRNSVYFDDSAAFSEQYFFPEDARKRIVKHLRDGDLTALNLMLDEITQKNINEAELSVEQVEQMLNEMHYTISAALRIVYDRSTVHVQMERPQDTMTFDEIIAYYKTVFETAVTNLAEQSAAEDTTELDNEVCQYIEEHFCDADLSLNAMTERFGVSPKVIGNICKKRYNATFLQSVRERQIKRAMELLQHTDLSLEEIAKQCGFVNVLTFRRNFKAVAHMNPSDFKR